MAKSKERSEVEALRSENRNLKKQVSYLKKELGRHEKREHQYLDLEDRTQQEELEKIVEVPKDKKICPKCNKGKLSVSDLGIRKLTTCNNCTFRKSEK